MPLVKIRQLRTDSLERRSVAWSAVGLGMLLVIGTIGAFILRQVSQADDWVDHTREVISNNQQLLSDVIDAESAERGYIITGDERYLEPYTLAAQDVPRASAKLFQLTADNQGQQQKLNGLQTLIGQRMAVLNDAVRKRKDSGFDAAQAEVLAGQGQLLMKQIRDTSQGIEAEEYRLLGQRTEQRQTRVKNGFVAILAASLVALLAFVIAPLDVRRAVRQRDLVRREKEESESRGRALFRSAAQAILIVDQGGRIISANPSTESMLGYAEDELLGQSIEVLVPGELRGGHVAHRDGYFHHPQSRPMGLGLDLKARRKDGSLFDAEISLSYIHSAGRTLAVAFVSDISKRKADEYEIRQQREDLRNLAGRLMTAQDDERRRIARDLHDDLSQQLAYLAMDIGKLTSKAVAQEFLADLKPLQRRAVEAAEDGAPHFPSAAPVDSG